MGAIGCATGILATLTFLLGLIPFLGWINWITTLPLAALAAALAYASVRNQPADALSRITLAASLILIAVTLFRLALGGGVI